MTTDDAATPPPAPARPFPIVGIGASAGGLDAFLQLLGALPKDTGMAFVVVQHLEPTHPSALAEILSRATTMPVAEAISGSVVEPDRVYVIPPGQEMVLRAGALQLSPRGGRGPHEPIDSFFRALAVEQRHLAIGVVLSGTASDGTLGLESIKAEGGITFAQDRTARQTSMPDHAVESGCVDFVLSPVAIAAELARLGSHPHLLSDGEHPALDDRAAVDRVLRVLRRETGIDFTDYKRNTLRRRIARRMAFAKKTEVEAYVDFLSHTPTEVQALLQDVLIGVTSFFRDPEAFAAIAEHVFPRLLADPMRTDPVRFWVVGCSTGQEAYSLAIAFAEAAEAAEATGCAPALQVFATDVNTKAIEKARSGFYGKEIAADVSPERLSRFFTEVEGGYRICKPIRDACVFSRHDVLGDPPFSHMDLVSCRNVLIYMEPSLQRRILPLLHYALRANGCLWLGASETIGESRASFDVLVGAHRIFAKRPGSEGTPQLAGTKPADRRATRFQSSTEATRQTNELPREAERVLLNRFAPPGVLVSPDLQILQFRGDTDPFLAPSPGRASLSLTKMLREGLAAGVRAALRRAETEKTAVRETGLRVDGSQGPIDVTVEVIPLRGRGGALDGGYLVLFETVEVPGRRAFTPQHPAAATGDERARLEQELAATRDHLQSVIEQHEIASEELQSASEEVQSANEQLQSTNEELETSKEEVQSSNEELATVNDELSNRNAALQRVNDDLHNLFDSVQMVVVMLDADLRVRRFTPMAQSLLNLRSGDVGRRLAELSLELEPQLDLERLLAKVRDSGTEAQHEVKDRRGRWHSLRLRPYRTQTGAIDGVVVTLFDVDLIKRSHAFTESIVATVHEPLLVLDGELRVRATSPAFYETFRTTADDTIGKELYELGDRQWDVLPLRALLAGVVQHGRDFSDFAVTHEFPQLGRRTMLLNARRLVQGETTSPSVLLAIEDVTERKRKEDALQLSETRFRRLFETSQDGILLLDGETGRITQTNPQLTSLLGFPLTHFLGKELWELGFFADRRSNAQALQQIGEEGSVRYEHVSLADRDGRPHSVEMVANAYREGDRRVVQCNVRDTSERRSLETKLRAQAEELIDLDRRKDEFLAMLGHELRSPLAPIANAVRVLGQGPDTDSPARSQARAIVERQVAQLQHLVDDLLDVSRITTGRLQLRREYVDANLVAKGAIETVRPMLEDHRHHFELSLPDEPILLFADVARIEQVLTNLLTNAIKFTEVGGRIRLSARREGDDCVFRVEDSGVGISPSLLPHVFELFTQGKRSLDRSEGGLGIGLALVARLTALHGGTVEVHSVVGRGSVFVVRLPVAHQPAPQPETVEAPLPKVPPLRILVVDDSVDTATSFAMLLENSGHEVRTAGDGPTALPLVVEFRPDVVLLDIGLPGLDGYEVARRLRREPELAGTLLIALTGYGQDSDRQKALQAGFDDHLVKPVDFQKLEKLLLLAAARSKGPA